MVTRQNGSINHDVGYVGLVVTCVGGPGGVALLTMADALGMNKAAPSTLRKPLHRVCGYVFTSLYVVFLIGMFVRLERFGPRKACGSACMLTSVVSLSCCSQSR